MIHVQAQSCPTAAHQATLSMEFSRQEYCNGYIPKDELKTQQAATSLVVQWLRVHAPYAGGPGSIPGQRTSSHMPK